MLRFNPVALVMALLCVSTAHAAADSCRAGLGWQVLGSGGPELNRRAQSGHALWIDGKARVLIDAGAGTAVNFGKAGGDDDDLDAIALSHLHSDHSVDVAALVKAGYFGERDRALPIYGPPGGGRFPSTEAWLAALLGKDGAYRYLSGYLGDDETYRIEPHSVVVPPGEIRTVLKTSRFTLRAAAVGHGSVPALAWRIDVDGKAVVYTGDTHGNDPALVALARDADLMVANMAVPEDVGGGVRSLHMPPSRIAAVAHEAGVRRLLLSHLMRRSEAALPEALATIAESYRGPVSVAVDMGCTVL